MTSPVKYLIVPCLVLALGCSSFTNEEKELISKSGGKIMRVLTTDSYSDSSALRNLSMDLTEQDVLSADFRTLAAAMYETVNDPSNPGVGIAAPQVGIFRKLIVVQRYDREGQPFEAMINPEILSLYGEIVPSSEGCLSIPDIYARVPRYSKAIISYRDSSFTARTDTLEGYTAIIVQHETDHLKGILFTDRIIDEEQLH